MFSACPAPCLEPDQDSYLRFAFANSPAEDMALLVERLIESQPMMIEGEGRSICFHDDDNHLFELHTGTLRGEIEALHNQIEREMSW